MYLCYIDESGTPEIPGTSSHFVLLGIAIPIEKWKVFEKDIERIKIKYNLAGKEIHTAWLLRNYLEQQTVPNFETLDLQSRRTAVCQKRAEEQFRVQKLNKPKQYRQLKKNYKETIEYIHLTRTERQNFVKEVASKIGSWGKARIFAECIDKVSFDITRNRRNVEEQAFEQIVSRFEQYLQSQSLPPHGTQYGILIHDNNDTISQRYVEMMQQFHASGTFWVSVRHIIEIPFFVDSKLTGMVQIADLCSYALRRYLENGEDELFKTIFPRGDRKPSGECVGIRHFSKASCTCMICAEHKRNTTSSSSSCS